MSSMTLALLDTDPYFGEMLSAYIRGSAFADRFLLKRFTTKEEGLRYMQEEGGARILLVHDSWLPLPEEVFGSPQGAVVLLSETAAAGGILEYPVLCKYQPLDRLMGAISSHYNEYSTGKPLLGRRGTRSVVLHSAVGGAGKTVTAFHTARLLALRGERVLLLNLERYPSLPWFAEEAGDTAESFSRLLYYAKSNAAGVAGKLEGLVRRHAYGKFDYVPPSVHPQEMEELAPEHALKLVEGMVAAGLYDTLIIDTDSYAPKLAGALLGAADEILWLVTDDLVQLHKTSRLLKSLQGSDAPRSAWMPKVRFVLNRSTGQIWNSWEAYGLKVHAFLPYVPEWKAVSRIEQLQHAPAFEDAAGGLLGAQGGGAG
ncbi:MULTISPECIES: nucleotide-binding protein [Paenibacillus]|uniref:nucleotide-binding protein n=1 Tax=Paenibacillus TaxID=44249 RepID=UPI0022B89993|nr:hypothetical protein [Paenibacillus caseinilyticus]MCZ8521508.1 hypothetical protein [Paenibacillus caseinilyticus]